LCLTEEALVVLVTEDGETWGLPGGRPDGEEDWIDTLRREVREEACASVREATLLGFTRSVCHSGPEKDLVLVRSFWCARISVATWDPHYEMKARTLLNAGHALALVSSTWPEGGRPMLAMFFEES